MKIIIGLPLLSAHDAISNDVLQQCDLLIKNGLDAAIYATEVRLEVKNMLLINRNFLIKFLKKKENILIYHHGVAWEEGKWLLNEAKCKVWVKYHNVTPARFYKDYDKEGYYATQAGESQTHAIACHAKIEKFIGASAYNCESLKKLGVESHRMTVIPPFLMTEEYNKANIDLELTAKLDDGNRHFLTVGRVVPNKGHSHLIHTVQRYVNFFGPRIKLHIVGSLTMQDKRYYYELEDMINHFNLGEQINFHQNTNFDEMHTFYRTVDALIMMSEHEGFCLPIAEAQLHKLPIIALDRGAVGETLGANQLLFKEPDYDIFAVALHRITQDQTLREIVTTNGINNFNQRFQSKVILKQLLSLI